MEMTVLKKLTYAMLVSGLLVASFGATADSAIPDQSDSLDYGVRIAKANSDSPFPTESDVVDYGVRVAV